MRDRFAQVTTELLEQDERVSLVLADISADRFTNALHRHPDRVVNVGIREQAMVGVAAGMALAGLRPLVHTYAPFLVERPFEQVKLDLVHQDVGAVLVSIGASYDASAVGYTHHAPGDVALLDTLAGWTVHVPGHADEVEALLRQAARTDDRVYIRLAARSNSTPHVASDGRMAVLRRGTGPTVIAVGPMLDAVADATRDLDVNLLYTHTVRPFDRDTLRGVLTEPTVVLVEPYLRGTSTAQIAEALADMPHRTVGLGVPAHTARMYGDTADHDAAYGLDPAGLRASIRDSVAAPESAAHPARLDQAQAPGQPIQPT